MYLSKYENETNISYYQINLEQDLKDLKIDLKV